MGNLFPHKKLYFVCINVVENTIQVLTICVCVHPLDDLGRYHPGGGLQQPRQVHRGLLRGVLCGQHPPGQVHDTQTRDYHNY